MPAFFFVYMPTHAPTVLGSMQRGPRGLHATEQATPASLLRRCRRVPRRSRSLPDTAR